MDNELDTNQVKMVDEFLMVHPDLRAEFEMLMSTKLPLEKFSLDKKDLLAESMKQCSIAEDLLLYIDNELTADQKKTVEAELATSKDYQLQHRALLQTKLDPSEEIAYPNKKELYHRTERVISLKVGMRVAAAVLIIAISGIVYFMNPPGIITTSGDQNVAVTKTSDQKTEVKQDDQPHAVTAPSESKLSNETAVNTENTNRQRTVASVINTKEKEKKISPEQSPIEETLERPKVNAVESNGIGTIAMNSSNDILNTVPVTSLNQERKTIKETPVELGESANRKGSLKGFLRKATRVIEKRTGIDPTNGNGDLLIGAVPINLK